MDKIVYQPWVYQDDTLGIIVGKVYQDDTLETV